jgi:hypothetical protein
MSIRSSAGRPPSCWTSAVRTLPGAELIEADTKTFDEARREPSKPRSEPPDVGPEVIANLRASMTERWLSEQVPALEGLSPRQAASSGAYQPQLRSLLRGIAALSSNKLAIDIDAVIADLGITPWPVAGSRILTAEQQLHSAEHHPLQSAPG